MSQSLSLVQQDDDNDDDNDNNDDDDDHYDSISSRYICVVAFPLRLACI